MAQLPQRTPHEASRNCCLGNVFDASQLVQALQERAADVVQKAHCGDPPHEIRVHVVRNRTVGPGLDTEWFFVYDRPISVDDTVGLCIVDVSAEDAGLFDGLHPLIHLPVLVGLRQSPLHQFLPVDGVPHGEDVLLPLCFGLGDGNFLRNFVVLLRLHNLQDCLIQLLGAFDFFLKRLRVGAEMPFNANRLGLLVSNSNHVTLDDWLQERSDV
mmetsp:Transcript_89097/g.260433  ORF Transcript_89097/g.260433 Transcript_89097/m.260433 type:complete len:213 (-) Transcript_89097:482-1120(-)